MDTMNFSFSTQPTTSHTTTKNSDPEKLKEFEIYCLYICIGLSIFGFLLTFVSGFIFSLKQKKKVSDIYTILILFYDTFGNAVFCLYASYISLEHLRTSNSWMCPLVEYLWYLVPTIAWLLLLSVALMRYVAVCRPHMLQHLFSRVRIVLNIVVINIMALVMTLPFMLNCAEIDPCHRRAGLLGGLGYDNTFLRIYIEWYRLTIGVITAILLVFFYSQVVHELNHQDKTLRPVRREENQRRQTIQAPTLEEEQRLTNDTSLLAGLYNAFDEVKQTSSGVLIAVKDHITITLSSDTSVKTEVMFINITLLYLFLNLPYAAVEYRDNTSDRLDINPHGTGITIVVFNLSFIVNPILVYLSNHWFRSNFNGLFTCQVRNSDNELRRGLASLFSFKTPQMVDDLTDTLKERLHNVRHSLTPFDQTSFPGNDINRSSP